MLVEQLKMKLKGQKGGFLGMLMATSGASLLGNMIAGKAKIAKIPRRGVIRAGQRNQNWSGFFMPSQP